KNVPHSWDIQNVRHQRQDDPPITGCVELLLNAKELHLTLINQKQSLRLEAGNLRAECASNSPPGTSHHDNAPVDDLWNVVRIQHNRLTAQKVLNFNRAKLTHFHFASAQLIQRRHSLDLQTRALKNLHRFADPFGGSAGHGDDRFFELEIQLLIEE